MVRRTRHHRESVVPVGVLLAALLVALTTPLALSGAVRAQEPEIDFRILKINCPEDPGTFPEGVIPEDCTPVEGVAFTVADTEGNEIASCTTNADGRCLVHVESGTDVVVEEDEATGTEGYSPLENPIETTAVSEFAGAEFVNVKDAAPQ